jgi:hypothetical protein
MKGKLNPDQSFILKLKFCNKNPATISSEIKINLRGGK